MLALTIESAPEPGDVRAALLWALENDRGALLEHRESTQAHRGEASVRGADLRLVSRWRAWQAVHRQLAFV